jgi:hypothetical protein
MRRSVRIALFASLSATVGFMMAPVPNIELFTFTIFCGAYSLGYAGGCGAALIATAIYYGLNPYGSSLMFPPLFAAQLMAAVIIALLGASYRRLNWRGGHGTILRRVLLVPFAATAALMLPLLPSLSLWLIGGGLWQGWMMIGLLMTAWGFIFNMIIFLTSFEPLARQIERLEPAGFGEVTR